MLYNYPGRMGVSMGEEYFCPRRPVEERRRHQGKLGRHGPGAHAGARVSEHRACPAAGTTRRSSSSPGGRGAGCAPGRTSCRRSTSRSTRPASSRRTSTRAGAIMTAMLPLMNFLDGGKFVQSIKYGCELDGLKAGSLRAPLRGLERGRQARPRDRRRHAEAHRRADHLGSEPMTDLLTAAEYSAIAADPELLRQRLHRRRLPARPPRARPSRR